jgi:hypothetical protein
VNSIVVVGSQDTGWTFDPTRPYGLDDGMESSTVELVRYDSGRIEPGTYETGDTISPDEGSSQNMAFSLQATVEDALPPSVR